MFARKHMLALAVASAFIAGTAHAATQAQQTANGIDYVMGGVTVEELQALKADKDQYSLWVTTAAKGTGAFLSDADVRITDAKNDVVLDTTVEGPWLFVNLPPGTYTVEATVDGQVQTHRTHIAAGDHHQALMYFDSTAQLSPDWVSPFAKSPYAGSNG